MNNVALHIKKKKPTTVQITYILEFKINITGKKDKRTADSVPLGPWAPGLASHSWSLEQAGSPGGAVLGLRALGRICQPISPQPRWTWTFCSPLHESTISRSCGTLLQQN